MVSEAYKNKQDKLAKIRTSAYACTAQDIGKVFYYLNPNCTAHLFLRAFNSNKRESYFSTKKEIRYMDILKDVNMHILIMPI